MQQDRSCEHDDASRKFDDQCRNEVLHKIINIILGNAVSGKILDDIHLGTIRPLFSSLVILLRVLWFLPTIPLLSRGMPPMIPTVKNSNLKICRDGYKKQHMVKRNLKANFHNYDQKVTDARYLRDTVPGPAEFPTRHQPV